MKVKKVKRKCNVLGCRNTDCYSLTTCGEHGNSVIACKSCLEGALKAIEELEKQPEQEKKRNIPPLFFNGLTKTTESKTDTAEVKTMTQENKLPPEATQISSKQKKNSSKKRG